MTEQAPIDPIRYRPPSADEDVAKLRLQLNQKSLEELVRQGLVEWDKKKTMLLKKAPNSTADARLKADLSIPYSSVLTDHSLSQTALGLCHNRALHSARPLECVTGRGFQQSRSALKTGTESAY
jgi:hypothetical protein